MHGILKGNIKNIGILATRLAGTDGVSLESAKLENIFEEGGFTCYYFAGELDRPVERSFLVEEAHFRHPEIRNINQQCFGATVRDRSITRKIQQIKSYLKDCLYELGEKYFSYSVLRRRISVFMAENFWWFQDEQNSR